MSSLSEGLPALQTSEHDDPRVLEEAATEDYSLHVVPRSWRLSKGQLTMAFFAVTTTFFYLYFAAFVSFAYGTVNALIGIGLSIIVYTVVNSVILRVASRSGLTVALFSRGMFGFLGSAIVTAIFAATAIYFFVFESSVIAVALEAFIGGPLKLWYAVVIVGTAPLVWRGVRVWLDRFNAWLLPVFVVLLAAVIVWALSSKGYHGFLPDAHAAPGTKLPWLQTFSAYMGVWVLMMYTMDFARLGKAEDSRYHTNVTFGWTFYVLSLLVSGLVGILLVSTFGISYADLAGQESALPVRIVGLTGVLGLLLIVVTQTRINTVNLYLASTNLQSFLERALRISLPRTACVVIACAIGYALMLTNIFSYVNDALGYQGIAIVAWVAIALTHTAYLRRRGVALNQVEFRPGRVPNFNPGGILAWVSATAVGVLLKVYASGASQVWSTWGLIITFVVAAGVYGAALLLARPSWFVLARPHDPAEEVTDPWSVRVRCHVCERSYIAREMDRDPSADNQAICSSCASASGFHRVAEAESRAMGTTPTTPAPEQPEVANTI